MYADEQCINGVKISKNCVKSLGIYLGHDKIQCYEKKPGLANLKNSKSYLAFGKDGILQYLASAQ